MQRHELIQICALKNHILLKYSLEIKGRCIEQKKKRKETGSTTNKMRNAAKRKF